jgi:hypothetical protein
LASSEGALPKLGIKVEVIIQPKLSSIAEANKSCFEKLIVFKK